MKLLCIYAACDGWWYTATEGKLWRAPDVMEEFQVVDYAAICAYDKYDVGAFESR